MQRIREFAYELKLLDNNKIHNAFHVTFLKRSPRVHIKPSLELPPLEDEGKFLLKDVIIQI